MSFIFRKALVGLAAMVAMGAAQATSIDPDLNPASDLAVFSSGSNIVLNDTFTFTLGAGLWNSVAVVLPSGYALSGDEEYQLDAGSWTAASFFNNLGTLSGGGHSLALRNFDATGYITVQASVAPVPEPETYAMMLAGLGALGFMARRRQAK